MAVRLRPGVSQACRCHGNTYKQVCVSSRELTVTSEKMLLLKFWLCGWKLERLNVQTFAPLSPFRRWRSLESTCSAVWLIIDRESGKGGSSLWSPSVGPWMEDFLQLLWLSVSRLLICRLLLPSSVSGSCFISSRFISKQLLPDGDCLNRNTAAQPLLHSSSCNSMILYSEKSCIILYFIILTAS